MALATITLSQMAADIRGAAARTQSLPAPLLRLLALAAVADTKRNFDESADPDGRPWSPLAFPRTSGGDRPLRDKGLLLASISGGANHVERYAADSVTVGTNRPGAALHQAGGVVVPKQAKWLAIPATREAARVGSPRNFPRPLAFIFGKRGGVAVERPASVKRGLPPKGGPKLKAGVVQYYFTKKVTVPARVFLGAGQRLVKKLDTIAADFWGRMFGGG